MRRKVVAVLFAFCIVNANASVQKVSRFGQYSGYSEPVYDGWKLTSEYITVRDGTKLAADIYRPTKNGVLHTKPLPVIWMHDRYQRRWNITKLDSCLSLRRLNHYGYIIADVDARGTGASFGSQPYFFSEDEILDVCDTTEWLASQPYCDGNVGMTGGSYFAIMQYFAAGINPPHLKAVFPLAAVFDFYSFMYEGGIYRNDFMKNWQRILKYFDIELQPVPVDDDPNGRLLKEAVRQHQANRDVFELFSALPYRNSIDSTTNKMLYFDVSPCSMLSQIRKSRVAIYHWGGWFDIFTRDTILWYANLDNPQKITMGPWSHCEIYSDLTGIEQLRWFDYWLKGIDNGIMDELPIHYIPLTASNANQACSARYWPPLKQKPRGYYFHAGPSHSISSKNDGILTKSPPLQKSAFDPYTVDYTTSSGKPSRWSNGYGDGNGHGKFKYHDMSSNDANGLTYTTEPLTCDTDVTGHPIVHLWISSDSNDADFFVYLEEIDSNGLSNYVTEGCLRASLRSTSKPKENYLSLPYHRCFKEDVQKLPPEKPVELIFDMQPTSNIFDEGHRIRVTITCADKGNYLTPQITPPPHVKIYRDAEHPSRIVLPVD